jgi:imidazolonepropionase-like amidohydrolase
MEKQSLIICGKLFDGIKDELQENMEILVEGKQIKEVGKNLSRPKDVEIIDLSHLTVTPGMIDAHVHGNLMRWQEVDNILFHSEGYSTLAFLHTAERCLERGFTTIRCNGMGPRGYGIVDAKRVIDRGLFPAARMNVGAHMLGGPGMPGDMSMYAYENQPLSDYMQIDTIGSGPDFFRTQVRREVKYGTDFIKIFLSGSFLSPDGGPEISYLDDQELETIIRTAHDLGKPVTAHVYPPRMMKKLLQFGIDGMEHGALMDEETARMFEESDTYLVPTFSPFQDTLEDNNDMFSLNTEDSQMKLKKFAPQLKESRRIIRESKIRLGYGSDFCAVHQPYESWYEYRSWLRSGMDPFRTLKAATSVNAGILRLDHLIGTIEPGKYADVAAWHRDLLTDCNALSECDFVMKEGKVYPTDNKIVDEEYV